MSPILHFHPGRVKYKYKYKHIIYNQINVVEKVTIFETTLNVSSGKKKSRTGKKIKANRPFEKAEQEEKVDFLSLLVLGVLKVWKLELFCVLK